MNLFNELLDFLEQKVFIINAKHIEANKEFQKNNLTGNCDTEQLNQAITDHHYRQLQINLTTNFIFQLSKIKLTAPAVDNDTLNVELNKIIQSEIDLITSGQKPFNKQHALYGFTLFHNKLVSAYAKIEAFEECERISQLQ